MGGLDFSFSGLKTSILYRLQKEKLKDDQFVKRELNNICASVQKNIIDILMEKLLKAAHQTGIKQRAIAGGVSANSGLRVALNDLAEQQDYEVYMPKLEYCTDNAAMIGVTAHFKFQLGEFASMDVAPAARL